MRCVNAGLLFSYNSEKIGSRVTLDGTIILNGRVNCPVDAIVERTTTARYKEALV
jgi:hypothetical protein